MARGTLTKTHPLYEHVETITRSQAVPCNQCGSQNLRPYCPENGLGLVQCLDCKLVFVGRRPETNELYALYGEPRYVSALAEDLGMPQPTVSRHLQVLRQRALVQTERDGQTVVYSLTDTRIIEVLNTMRQILRDSLDRQANVLA